MPPPKTCQFFIWPLYKLQRKNQLLGSPPRFFSAQKINGPKRIRRFYLCDPVRVFFSRCYHVVFVLFICFFRAFFACFIRVFCALFNGFTFIFSDLKQCQFTTVCHPPKSVNSSYNNHSSIDLRKCVGGSNHLVGIMCAVSLMAQHQAPFLSVK